MRAVPLALAVLMLGGCGTVGQPPLYSAPARDLQGTELTAALLEDARNGQVDFAQRYRSAARTSDLSNLPLIAAATATAALLLAGGNDTAIGAVGLGSGAYVATREVLTPKQMAGLYLEGHAALGCVRRHGAPFAGVAAQTRREAFGAALDALRLALADADAAALVATPDGASPSDGATFLATQARLRDALVTGRLLEAAAEREAAAFEGAPSVVAGAVEGVYARVAGRSRAGRDVDVERLTQSLFQGAQAFAAKPGAAATPDAAAMPMLGANVGGAQQQATAALRAVTLASGRVRAETPGYLAALARIDACVMG